jgi:hypothetical protein
MPAEYEFERPILKCPGRTVLWIWLYGEPKSARDGGAGISIFIGVPGTFIIVADSGYCKIMDTVCRQKYNLGNM